jgi:hypothetical protein
VWSKAIHAVSKSGSGWPPSRTTETNKDTNMKAKATRTDEKCMQRSGRKFDEKVPYGTVQEGSAPLKK